MQVLREPRNTNETLMQVVRIPPVRIKVEKPSPAPFFFVFSATNQGVHICIFGTKTNGPAGFDDGLSWRVYCENQHSILRSLVLTSAFKMKLTGPDGKEVPRTDLGQIIGVNFDGVKTSNELSPGNWRTGSELDFRSGVPGIAPTRPLPLLKDCFAMDKPGIYTLELQAQFYRVNYDKPSKPETEELLRFPPMTIKVNRP